MFKKASPGRALVEKAHPFPEQNVVGRKVAEAVCLAAHNESSGKVKKPEPNKLSLMAVIATMLKTKKESKKIGYLLDFNFLKFKNSKEKTFHSSIRSDCECLDGANYEIKALVLVVFQSNKSLK